MRSERGSALLIVFVFAAIVAIMLYRALPDAMFEGQRQKEQLLIDRGTEYKTAIKRFLVRNKTYPTSLDQLDNFNNVRYIRHRFKDPMTGKQEWRMIHVMNPGFILTDSKVKPLNQNQLNGAGGFGSNTNTQSGFGSNNTGGFGSTSNNGSGSNTSSFGSNKTSGFGNTNSNSSSFGNNSSSFNTANNNTSQQPSADPNAPPAPSAAQLYGAQRRPPAAPITGMPGEQPPAGDQLADKPLPEPAPAGTALNGQINPANTPGSSNPLNPGAPGAPPDPNNPASAGIDAVNSSLRRQGPTPTAFGSSSTSQTGGITVGAGAIAGVASTATGSSIKVMDGQTDYSKWEFVYNPQTDAASKLQNALGNNNRNPNQNGNGNPGGFGNSSNQSNSTSTFGGGTSSFGSSTNSGGFGASNSGSSTTASPATPVPQ